MYSEKQALVLGYTCLGTLLFFQIGQETGTIYTL